MQRKIQIVESRPETFRFYDQMTGGQDGQLSIKEQREEYNKDEILNFDEFKSNLDNKMNSVLKDSYNSQPRLKIVATSADLPPDKRD